MCEVNDILSYYFDIVIYFYLRKTIYIIKYNILSFSIPHWYKNNYLTLLEKGLSLTPNASQEETL